MQQKLTSFFVFLAAIIICGIIILLFADKAVFSRQISVNDRITDEIIVKFKDSADTATIKIAQIKDYDKILNYYNNLAEVEYAEANYFYQASIIPSDTLFANQWYLQKIKAVEAWDKVRESPETVIAIIDSGIQINHPDLKSNIWLNSKEIPDNNIDDDRNGFIDDINGWDFVNNTADPEPKFQAGWTEAGILHGTIIAGIAAASGNNAAGIAGVTWRAKIMPLKALDDKGEGSTNTVVKAIDYAIHNGADIINLSFVGLGYSKTLDEAIKRAYDAGIIIVAAGGNETEQGAGSSLDITPMYPVCHDGPGSANRVIGVAATDTIDQKAPFSSYGFKCIDISAPGMSIFSTIVYQPDYSISGQAFNNYYGGYWSGTSVAVPMVSGALALIKSANPGLNRNQIIKILFDNSDNINRLNPNYLNKLGKGRLNVALAVSQAVNLLNSKTAKLIVAPFSNLPSLIKITDQDGKTEKQFFAYEEKFKGGASITSGDVNGDGLEEIITGARAGGGPHVRIFNINGELVGQFFAYSENFRGGVNVAAGDIDQDGLAEIITAPSSNAAPEIKIFDYRGKLKRTFLAYDKNFRGGVNLAVGDINSDGMVEIVTGAGAGGGPHVRVFKPSGQVISQFFAYDKQFRGGVKIAIGKITNNLRSDYLEIVTAPGKGGGPHIKIFNSSGILIKHFFAFTANFRGGVNLAAADINNDGFAEIIAGAGPSGAPHVRVFDRKNNIIGSFYAFAETDSGGVNVGIIQINK